MWSFHVQSFSVPESCASENEVQIRHDMQTKKGTIKTPTTPPPSPEKNRFIRFDLSYDLLMLATKEKDFELHFPRNSRGTSSVGLNSHASFFILIVLLQSEF